MIRKKFTLIELLVVIAMMAILAAMLLPALGSVRDRSKTMGCVSNQKQLITTFNLYLTDFKYEFYQKACTDETQNLSFLNYATVFYAFDYLEMSKVYFCPARTLNNPEICWERTKSNPLYFVIGFRDLHSYSTPNNVNVKNWSYKADFRKVQKPNQYFIFADTRSASLPYPMYGCGSSASVYPADDNYLTVYEAHAKKLINAAYLDGHAESAPGRHFTRNTITSYQYNGGPTGWSRAWLNHYNQKRTLSFANYKNLQ